MASRRVMRVAGAAALVGVLAGAAVVLLAYLARRAKEGVLVMPAGWQNDVDINMTCDSMCIPCLACKNHHKQAAPQQAQLAQLTANKYGRSSDWVGPYGRGPDGGVAAWAAQQATATPSNSGSGGGGGGGGRQQSSGGRQQGSGGGGGGNVEWRKGNATHYNSHPDCCDDPTADQRECRDNNGCTWKGKFADGTRLSKSEVQQRNIVAFFVPPNERNQREWDSKYKGRWLRIKYGSRTIDAEIKDTCNDNDCKEDRGGCCTANTRENGGKYLLDLEGYTSARLFNIARNAVVDFQFITGPGGEPVPWSQVGL